MSRGPYNDYNGLAQPAVYGCGGDYSPARPPQGGGGMQVVTGPPGPAGATGATGPVGPQGPKGDGVPDLSAATGAALVGTVTGKLDKVLANGALYAGNYGVVGDGVTDDTAAAQAFINLAGTRSKIANFGGLRVKTSATLYVNNSSMVFDRCDYAGGAGLVPVPNSATPNAFADGVVNVYGICTALRATITGTGEVAFDAQGNITSDQRTKVDGFKLGNELGAARDTLILSNIEWARAWKLNGSGVRVVNAFDCRFNALSTEFCGNASKYALAIEDGGNTTNECVFQYLQCEQAANKGLFISPNTLSCTFLKIHAERADGVDGVDAHVLGPGVYSSARIQVRNGHGTAIWRAQSATVLNARAEDVTLRVDSTGGSITFTECSGIITPAPNANGRVQIMGGNHTIVAASTNWLVTGGVHSLSVGFCAIDGPVTVTDSTLTSLTRTDNSAKVTLNNAVVQGSLAGQWAEVRLGGYSRIAGPVTLSFCKFWLGAGGRVAGNVSLDNVGARINGRVEGSVTLNSRQTLWGTTSEVTGTPTNGAPESGVYLDGFVEGMYSKNPRPTVAGTSPSQYIVTGWQYAGGAWRECRVLTGT